MNKKNVNISKKKGKDIKILVINSGSSSLKYQLINMKDEKILAKGLCERIGESRSKITHEVVNKDKYSKDLVFKTHKEAINKVIKLIVDKKYGVIKDIKGIKAIGHRVLHGGNKFNKPMIVNNDVKKAIKEYIKFGPLHNPANLMGIESCEEILKNIPNIVVFDTSFGCSMDEKAYMYGIPYEYYKKYKIRRYGFHGISHSFINKRIIEFAKLDKKYRKVIVCHLGNGASISAANNGKCVDTSMGLSPLEGLFMGTRSGDVDPTVLQFIVNQEKKNINEVLTILNKKSGLLGISGISNDSRDVENASEEGNKRAKLAIEMFNYKVAKYIGAYVAALNGVDVIVFTGGIGENSISTRKAICKYLKYLGVKIDNKKNKIRGKDMKISTDDSNVKVYIIKTNEELEIARETLKLIKK